jgi:hypothetical protein
VPRASHLSRGTHLVLLGFWDGQGLDEVFDFFRLPNEICDELFLVRCSTTMQLAKKKKGKRKTRCRTLKHFRGVVLIRVALARDWDLVADLLKGRTRVQVHNTAGHDCKELRDALVL